MPTLAVVLLVVVAQQNWPQNWLKKPVAVQKWKKTIENLGKKKNKKHENGFKKRLRSLRKSPEISGKAQSHRLSAGLAAFPVVHPQAQRLPCD